MPLTKNMRNQLAVSTTKNLLTVTILFLMNVTTLAGHGHMFYTRNHNFYTAKPKRPSVISTLK